MTPTETDAAADGGSDVYGGPQDPVDGSVRVYGDYFLIRPGESQRTYASPPPPLERDGR